MSEGLSDGDEVVVAGQSRLQAGTQGRDPGRAGESGRARRLTGAPVSISTPFIRRPVATSLLMAAFLFVGIVAYPFLPVAPLPRVDFPTILVTGKLPERAPRRWRAPSLSRSNTSSRKSPASRR